MRLLLLLCLVSIVTLSAQAAKVVSLGDSYSSGVGIRNFSFGYDETFGATASLDGISYQFAPPTAGGVCLRETDTTPGARLARDLGMDLEMLACSGAEIPNLYDQIDYLNARFPEEYANQWKGSVFILTLGLNDLRNLLDDIWLFMLVGRCILRSEDCSQDPNNQIRNGEEVAQDLTRALSYLAGAASGATIRILGYGKLFQRNGGDCSDSFRISNTEADFGDNNWFDVMNSMSFEAIQEIKQTTSVPFDQVDIEFVDVTSYLNVGTCSKESRHLNGFFEGFPLGMFHPTQLGYDQYYQALVDNISFA